MWKVKPHFEALDTGTSASFIIHWAQRTSAMSHLPNGKIEFTDACSHKCSPDKYKGLVVLSISSKKHHLYTESSSAARFSSCQIECDAIQFRWVRDPGKQAWTAGVSLSSTSRCKKVSWFQLRSQKCLKTFDRDLALFPKRFGVHSHNIHNPRNAPVLVVAVAPCEFAPGFSRPSPAWPSPPNRQCLAHLTTHGWIYYHFFVPRKSKIKRSPKSTEQSMKSPGSLLGARHFDRYKTKYPRVSVMTLQSPHHAAREKHLDWCKEFCSGKSEIPWIHVEFTDWLYTSLYYTINLNLQIVFCILSNGSLCYHVAILIKPFYGALHVTRVMYPVSHTD